MAKTGTGKYGPVVTRLRDRISGGDLAPGDWLPSESQLMDTFGVSRYSAREAIKKLAGDGLVVVVDGKGSYVRARTHRARHSDVRAVVRANETLHDAELDRWSPVEEPATYRADAGIDVALTLGVDEHSPVFGHDRLLERPGEHGAGTRRMLHRLYLPMATCARVPVLADNPFPAPDALYAALTAASVRPTLTEHVRAVPPTPEDIASLNLPPGTPVLVTRRTMRDADGRALAMEETRRSAEDTQLTYPIVPTTPVTTTPAATATPPPA